MIDRNNPGGRPISSDRFGTPAAHVRRRWEEIDSIRQAELGPLFDVGLRHTLIFACIIPLCLVAGTWGYLLWALSYLMCNTGYLTLLSRITPPVSTFEYRSLLFLHLTGNVLFAGLPVYILYAESGIAIRFIALCALVGYIMFNLTRRKIVSRIAFIDISIIVVTLIAMAVNVMLSVDGFFERALILIGSLAIATYYVQAHLGSIHEHLDLLRVRREAIDAQRDNAAGQITAGIAHDFNNILTAVQGNIQLAELAKTRRETNELLSEALACTARASDIVSHLTAYVGKSQLQARQIFVRDVFEEIAPQLKAVLPSSVHLTLQQPAGPLSVLADKSKLETALINLAENSADALRENGGRIVLGAEETYAEDWPGRSLDQTRTYVAFRLRDTGPGMDPNLLHRATEPFFSTKPKATGSGLGLSMVKGFAKQSNGALDLRNHPEGGFEVSLILPMSQESVPYLD